MIEYRSASASLFVLAAMLVSCSGDVTGNNVSAGNSVAQAEEKAVYQTYGVHNPPGDSPCERPDCSYAGQANRPPDPSYPLYWQSPWTMYRVFAGYETHSPPYNGKPPAGTQYETSFGASYYDSTWRGKSGEGAMMEYYEKRCLPIFPNTPNTFTCAFISLGDTAFFLTFPQDRPKGMPPVCLFSPLNHPPRQDFIKHLPWSEGDSARLGAGAQGYSFWINGDQQSPDFGKPIQTGVQPDRTAKGDILFGYAFAPVGGKMQPQSFYFSGMPTNPPNAPIVSQNYTNFQATKPDPKKTWDLVNKLDPATLPACTVMSGPSQPAAALKAGEKQPTSWFDIGRARRRGN